MKSTTLGRQTTVTAMSLQDAFRTWQQNPDFGNELALCGHFTQVLANYRTRSTENHTWAFQEYTCKKMVEACHFVLDTDDMFGDLSLGKIVEPLFVLGWWRRLVELGEVKLLAALILATVSCEDEMFRHAAIDAVADWTGQAIAYDVSIQDIGVSLFGRAWSLLYGDDLDETFEVAYKTIMKSNPTFFFIDNQCFAKSEEPTVVPDDVSV